jgi:DNA polymerase
VTPEERRRALDDLATEIGRCTNCRLHQGRTQAVPGEGHPETEVVFVGEGPGFNEDQQGRPFVGAAGTLLNDLLKSIGWSRQEVFITNVVKCRPPGNRDPEPDEIATCRPFLRRQLELLDPAVLVTLGRISTGALVPGARISGAHGTVRPLDPESGAADSLAYPMYHPAAAFRQPALRETLQADIAGLPDALLESRRRRAAKTGAIPVEAETVAPDPSESVATAPVPSDGPPPVESDVRELIESVPRATDAQEDRPNPNQMSLF